MPRHLRAVTSVLLRPMLSTSPWPASVLACLVAALLLVAGVANAQLGPYQPASSWWVGPGSTVGFTVNAGQITFDTNGDGLIQPPADHAHAIPAAILGAGWTYHLSPSRTVLYAVGPGGGSCPGGTTVSFYRIPPANGATLVSLTGAVCIPHTIAFEGFFDQPQVYSQRIAFVVDRDNLGTQQIRWFDLSTGANTWTDLPFSTVIEYVRFAPSGIAAWVHDDVSDGDNVSNWRVVSMCASNFGATISTGLPALNQYGPTLLTATIVSGAGGLETVAADGVSSAEVGRIPTSDCSPPPLVGACCLPNGSCQAGTTSAECVAASGTWRGAGTSCSGANCPPPPAPILNVTLAGPANVKVGRQATYVVSWSNTGNAAASSVILRDRPPAGTIFVRASNGGFMNGFDAQWSLGTLTPSAAGSCTLVVRAPCTGTSLVNNTSSITGTPGGTVNGTTSVTTTLTAEPTTYLTMSTTSVPQSPPPLATGGRVRHTIRMTNTLAVPREDLTMTLRSSLYTTVDQVLDPAGGSVSFSGHSITWQGTIAASATVQLVFDALVDECRPPTLVGEPLNNGLFIFPQTPCNIVGFAQATDTVKYAPPTITGRIEAPNAPPAQSWSGGRVIPVQAGRQLDLQIRIVNTAPALGPTCAASLTLPAGLLPIGNPPFIGPPPAGTTWDADAGQISWTGQPPASGSVVIPFRVLVDAGSSSMPTLQLTGDGGVCPGALNDAVSLVMLNPEPVGPHFTVLARYEGLWSMRPGLDTDRQPLVQFNPSDQRGMTRTPRGDYWVVGEPVYRVNPTLGEFEILAPSVLAQLDMDYPNDVVWDAADSTLIFAGYKSGVGLRVRRWNPRTRAVTVLYTSPGSLYFLADHVKLDPSRRVVLTSGNTLLRINPAVPGVATAWSDTSIGALPALDIDSDGSYLVIGRNNQTGELGRIARVDPVTGVFTVLADARALTGATSAMASLVVCPDHSLYAGYGYGAVQHFERTPTWSTTQVVGCGYVDDLEWVGGAPGTVGVPESAPGPAGLALAPPAPNPSRRSALVAFSLPAAGAVRLRLYDPSGRLVRTLADGPFASGSHSVAWDGRDASGNPVRAGLFFVRLQTDGGTLTRKLVRSH